MYKRNEPVWRFLRPGGVRERLRSEMLFSQDRRSVFNTSCQCVYQMFRKRCIFIMIHVYWTIQFLLDLLDFSLPMEHRPRTIGPLITEYIITFDFSVFLIDKWINRKILGSKFSTEKSITFSYRISNLCVVFSFVFDLIWVFFWGGGRVTFHIPHKKIMIAPFQMANTCISPDVPVWGALETKNV